MGLEAHAVRQSHAYPDDPEMDDPSIALQRIGESLYLLAMRATEDAPSTYERVQRMERILRVSPTDVLGRVVSPAARNYALEMLEGYEGVG